MKTLAATCFSFLFCSASMSAAQSDQCADVLAGVYDFRSTATSSQRYDSFKNWFCNKENFESSGSASALYKGIPIGAQSDLNWAKDQCGSTQTSSASRTRMLDVIQTVNPNVVSAWESCMNRDGLKAAIIISSDPKQFQVILNYRRGETFPESAELLKGDSGFSVSEGASCNGPWLDQEVREVSGQIVLPCTRDNAKTVVTVTVNSIPSPVSGAMELPAHTVCKNTRSTYGPQDIADKLPFSVNCGFGSTFSCRPQTGSDFGVSWSEKGWSENDDVRFSYKTSVGVDDYVGMSVNGQSVSRNGSAIGCKYSGMGLSCIRTNCQ